MAEDLPSAITESAGQAATIRVGTVTSISPLKISIGDTVLDMEGVGVLGGAFAAIGTTVHILGQSVQGGNSSGASWVVLGAPGKGTFFTALTDVSVYVAASAQVTSAGVFTFSDVLSGGVALRQTVAKTRTQSRIAVDVRTSCFSIAGGSGVKYGVNVVNAVLGISNPYEIASMFINPASQHVPVSGFVHLPLSETLPPGSYQVTLRWRRYSGADSLNMNGDDIIAWRVSEVD